MTTLHKMVSGALARNAGGALAAMTQALFEACCCAAPCSCPDGLAEEYQLVESLTACASCTKASGTVEWDRVFGYVSACLWQAGGMTGLLINDKDLNGTATVLRLNTGTCKWELFVYCMNGPDSFLIWSGEKATGLTPAGKYTRTDGCDNTEYLTVEEAAP